MTAVGRSGGTERRIDAVLRVPPFPWAIVSGGRIETRNGVYVAALPEGTTEPPEDESKFLPADLIANGVGSKAISLGEESTILGDVEAVGGVFISSPDKVVVKGEIRSGSSPVEIPALRPTDFDPAQQGNDYLKLTEANLEELTGTARATRSLEFLHPLRLDNGRLYVDGDLALRGGISGQGVLIATGDITVVGGARVEAGTELAVVSGGTVRLNGEGADRSRIRGIFYAEDGLEAAELTLVGSLLTGNAATGITLDDVNIFHESEPSLDSTPQPTTFYFGRREPGASWATLDVVTSQTPSYEYGFSVTIEPASAETPYPMAIKVGPGFAIPATGSWTVANAQAFEALRKANGKSPFWKFFTHQFDHGYADHAKKLKLTVPKISTVDFFQNQVCGRVARQVQNSTVTWQTMLKRLSHFFPIEDRIRLISWLER